MKSRVLVPEPIPAYRHDDILDFIRPGDPLKSGMNKSFVKGEELETCSKF